MPGSSVISDITIVGAGPAGITAAIELGKKRIPCLLVDENHFPRKKICGDGLSGKALSAIGRIDPMLKEQLRQSEFAKGSRAVRFYSPSEKMAEISFSEADVPLPAGYICKRADFDYFLLKKALSYPDVCFVDGIRIKNMSRYGQKLIVENENSSWVAETKLLLLATGASQNLVKKCGIFPPGIDLEGIGIRAYFENVSGSDRQNAIEIHFLKELLPWYLWIFPYSDGSANVGLALSIDMARKNKRSLKELLFHLIEKYPYLKARFRDAEISGKVEAHRLPLYAGPTKICSDQCLLLGDAAKLIDPFTGEGISNAIVSGMIAADIASTCYQNNNYSRQFTDKYQEQVYDKLGSELALGLKLHNLARRPQLLNLVIGRASGNDETKKMLRHMLYDLNSKGNLKNPLFYLKLLLKI